MTHGEPTIEELTILAACALRLLEDVEEKRKADIAAGLRLIARVRARMVERIGDVAFDAFFSIEESVRRFDAFYRRAADEAEDVSREDLAFLAKAALLLDQQFAERDAVNIARGLNAVTSARNALAERLSEEAFARAFDPDVLEAAMVAALGPYPKGVAFYAYAADMGQARPARGVA